MSPAMNSFLADTMVTVHVAYVAFVVLGQILILVGAWRGWAWVRNPWFRLLHLVAIGAVVYEQVYQIDCPLSVWERQFREAAGEPSNGKTFVGRLMHNLIFIENASETFFDVLYWSVGGVIFLTFVFCPPRAPWRKPAATPA